MVDCLLAGLGNPGDAYEGTRHNIGFDALDAIVAAQGVNFRTLPRLLNGHYADITLADIRIKLIKPMTYMNNSGLTIAGACQYYGIGCDTLFVCYDDLDIQTGAIKVKTGGGNAGHNGIKSITQALGTHMFHRIRIGIDRPKHNAADYVLAKPNATQLPLLNAALALIVDNLHLIVTDVAKAQQLLHTKN